MRNLPITATAALFLVLAACIPAVVLYVDTTPTTTCQSVDAEQTDDASLSRLLADGWHGDPTDGTETLYSPTCN